MTTYKIETNASGEIFVKAFDKTDELGIGRFAGGPYKNEESAKRRIRDLKHKDAENAATAPENAAYYEKPTELGEHKPTYDQRRADLYDPTPRPSHYVSQPNATTVAALEQSAARKVTETAQRITGSPSFRKNLEMITDMTNHPIGVYPAVAKKFYRRQWR